MYRFLSAFLLFIFVLVPALCTTRGFAGVGWRPGTSTGISLGTGVLISDRPEGYPRKVRVTLQDENGAPMSRATFENLPGVSVAPPGSLITSATARGVGRISSRSRQLANGETITTRFEYADGLTPPPVDGESPFPAPRSAVKSGDLEIAQTLSGSAAIAGSQIARDATRRIHAAHDLGLGSRASKWEYDARGRLDEFVLGAFEDEAATMRDETLTDADMRTGRGGTNLLSAGQRNVLGDFIALSLESPTMSATQTSDGSHQLLERKLLLGDETKKTFAYVFDGGRRKSDGLWKSEYDAEGRLVTMAAPSLGRKITYVYDPMGRVVGRTAWRLTGENSWIVEDNVSLLQEDGLPARATFVWDLFTDRLLAIYEEGRGGEGAAYDDGLLRQYVHGDLAYDDPVEVLIRQPDSSVRRLLPIVDEAGTGSLIAVLGTDGNLVERVLDGDSYGDAPKYIHGPIVDRIKLRAKKDGAGNITEVTVKVHLTEKIREASTADALVIRSVEAEGGEVAEIRGASTIDEDDPYTLVRVLTRDQWTTLLDGGLADAIEIAVTSSVRAEAWGETPVAEAPEWKRMLFGTKSTLDEPVIHVESLSQLNDFFASIPQTESKERSLYEIEDLYMAAANDTKSKLLTGFHAYPFVEPANGMVYARARWYDPSTGTFVTPDPQGYIDSSNMYAFCGGDPVNCSDPTGEAGLRDWWNRNIDSLDEEGWKEFRRLLSGSVGALPIAGEITDAVQAVTGHDFIAGEKLETWERGVAAASILVPFGGARVLRKATGEAIDAFKASDDVVEKVVDATGGGAEDYLVSQRRITRYEAKLQQMVSSGTHRGEKSAELSGRVEMLKQGYLKEGHGIYEAQTRLITTASGKQVRRRVGGKGIDAVYRKHGTDNDFAILESKWRKDFSIGTNPESTLGRGIRNRGRSGPAYFEQMSTGWIREVRNRLLGSSVPGAQRIGGLLDLHGYGARYINVLNRHGGTVLHRMP